MIHLQSKVQFPKTARPLMVDDYSHRTSDPLVSFCLILSIIQSDKSFVLAIAATGAWDMTLATRYYLASPSSSVLPADPKLGFIVGGSSAGGNLSAVMCQLTRDEGLTPPLTGQYLSVPALLWMDAVPEK